MKKLLAALCGVGEEAEPSALIVKRSAQRKTTRAKRSLMKGSLSSGSSLSCWRVVAGSASKESSKAAIKGPFYFFL